MIIAKKSRIGKGVEIDPSADIRAGEVVLGNYVRIEHNFVARVAGKLEIGDCTTLGHDVSFTGHLIKLGKYAYVRERVTIGGGQSMSETSVTEIGNGCLICEDVLINNAMSVKIGNDVGIGKEVDIWTHAGFLGVLDGYPCEAKPVVIGSHVWIPSRTSILPGVTIGDHVIIGNHSLVNRDIPSGCFAAGVPVRIIRENCYPKILTSQEKLEMVRNIVNSYLEVMKWKGFSKEIKIEDGRIVFDNCVEFDYQRMTVTGELDEYAEDFRDHLRRNGIKFYTGKPFKSIIAAGFRSLI